MFARRTLRSKPAGHGSDTPDARPTVTPVVVRDGSETRRAAQIDLFAGIGEATERNLALSRILREAFALVDDMAAFSSAFDVTAEATQSRADRFVASVASLQSQSDVIEERLASAHGVVERAHGRSRAALSGVEELTAAIEEIGRAVSMIASIAAQTNLLALNATIEAARARTPKDGFLIVTSEVKALSKETERATREIAASVKRVRERADVSATEVKEFDLAIGGLQGVFSTMRAAIEAQGGQTREIGVGSEEIAALAQKVRGNAAKLQESGGTVRDMTGAAEKAAADARNAFAHLTDRAAIVLGHAELSGRGISARWPVALSAQLKLHETTYSARVIDLSPQAIQLETGADVSSWALGEMVEAQIAGIGRVSLRLLSPTIAGFETVVVGAAPDVARRIEETMDRLRVSYQPYIDRVQTVAADVERALEQMIETGRLTLAELFDANYRRVGTAEPAQYTTSSVAVLESCLRDRVERERLASPTPDFCLLQDRNGFNPVHNVVYCKPRHPTDERWNLRHSRMHRIFDDRVGMAAARNLQPFMVQSYARDMGDAIETRMEFDAPIFVAGRHWGTVRMAYKIEETDTFRSSSATA